MMIAQVLSLALVAALGTSDPDGVVATAPVTGPGAVAIDAVAPTAGRLPDAAQAQAVTPHGLTTDQQIARWLAGRTSQAEPFAEDDAPVDDRKMHGFVSGSIGTDDFSQVAVGVSLPIGEKGRLDLTYSQTRNGWGYGYPGYGYGGWAYDALEGPGLAPAWIGADRIYPQRGRLFGRDDRRSVRLSYRSRAEEDDTAPFAPR